MNKVKLRSRVCPPAASSQLVWWLQRLLFLGSGVFCVVCVRLIQWPSLPWLVSAQQWLHLTNVFPPSSSVPRCLAGFQAEREPCYYCVIQPSHPADDSMCAYKRAAEGLILLTFFLLTVNPSFTLVPVKRRRTIKPKPGQVQADREHSMWFSGFVGGSAYMFLFVWSNVGDHRAFSFSFYKGFCATNPLGTRCVSKTLGSYLLLKEIPRVACVSSTEIA